MIIIVHLTEIRVRTEKIAKGYTKAELFLKGLPPIIFCLKELFIGKGPLWVSRL